MRKSLFFFFFHEAGEGVGMERMLCWWLAELLLVVGGASVGGWRSFCWWLVELLLVVGGASVCDWWSFCWRKNKAFVWGDSKVLFVVKKRSFLPNALWNAFFFL